jgi:subtilase family serine protease
MASGTGVLSQVQPQAAGGNNCANPGVLGPFGNDTEAMLDIEYAAAMAPDANIILAACKDTFSSFGGLIAFNNLINSANPPPIFSISYGSCETLNGAAQNAAFNGAYQQAVAEGVSVFVSSGDQSAAQCDRSSYATHGIGANGLGSTVYNVNVGGTDYGDVYAGTDASYWSQTTSASPPYGSALSYVPEIPWNSSCGSVLTSLRATGSPVTYGANGFCNSAIANNLGLISTAGGSGGPSGCATGHTSKSGVVGGTCKGWPKPSWQKALGVPSDGVRDTPDVSLFSSFYPWSHAYFIRYCTTSGGGGCGTYVGFGGTSFASPIWAGIQALVNHHKISGTNPDGRQGNPNPTYYSLAKAEFGTTGSAGCNSTLGNGVSSTCTFYDVTQGDMVVPCVGTANCYRPSGSLGVLSTANNAYKPAYGTTKGYDFATGLGTPNVNNLVNNWP